MKVAASAGKHRVEADDITHAEENAVRLVDYEYDGEERLLIIGPDRSGTLVELVAVPAAGPTRIVHADRLRATFYEYLR